MKKVLNIRFCSMPGQVNHRIFCAMLGGLLLSVLFAGCSQKAEKQNEGVPVLAAKAMTTNVPVLINPPPVGHVMPYSTVTIHSQIQGMISQIHFHEGQEVKKGDPLFTIDPRPSQAVLDQARANLQRDSAQLAYAKISFAREKKLFDQKLISQDELDTNKASLDALIGTVASDKAAISNALLNVDFCHIKAPVEGITGGLQSYVGNVVKAPDDTLLTINQIHPIYVSFAVPEQYLPEIKMEMSSQKLNVSVSYENMKVAPPEGDLTFVDNTVDESTGTIQLRGTFQNEDNALWPGQFVQVNLTLSDLTNAVVVPTQAVQTGPEGQYIYVVNPNQTVEMRPVTAGIGTDDSRTVIEKGINAGETVVTDGQLRLVPGAKVDIKAAETSPTTATP